MIVAQLVVIDIRICDIAPRKSKSLAEHKILVESDRRVGYGLLCFDFNLYIRRVCIRRGKSIDIFGDELDAIRVAKLCGGDCDAARAFACVAPVGIVAKLVGGHALRQCSGQLSHVDVIGLVVDGDIGDGDRCWQAEAHDDVVAGRAVLVLAVNRVCRSVGDFARHRNGADAAERLAEGATVFVD